MTVHTLTQKSNAAHGGHLTAVDLAIAPRPKNSEVDLQPTAGDVSVVLSLAEAVGRPYCLRANATSDNSRGNLRRLECRIEFRQGGSPTGHGTLAVKIDAGAAQANVLAETIGVDTVRLIRQARRELVERTHVEVVYVELPLAIRPRPASPRNWSEMDSDLSAWLLTSRPRRPLASGLPRRAARPRADQDVRRAGGRGWSTTC